MRCLLVLASVLASQSPNLAKPIDVSAVTVGTPAVVAELDLEGDPRRLSWSPDLSSLYLQTVESDRAHDYVIVMADRASATMARTGASMARTGASMAPVDDVPGWADGYWARKSALIAPGTPSLAIEVTHTNRRTRPTPFSGGFANGGAQTVDPKNPVDAYEAEVTLRLLGFEIGNWVNGLPFAGETDGWGPAGSAAIVFVDGSRLTLLDRDKHRTTIDAGKGATLPAWSRDGSRIAYLQKISGKKYRLMTATVTR